MAATAAVCALICSALPVLASTGTNPCGPLFTDPAGDDAWPPTVPAQLQSQGQNPQVDILSGALALSPDGQDIVGTLTLSDLTATPLEGAESNEYDMYWTDSATNAFYLTKVVVPATYAQTPSLTPIVYEWFAASSGGDVTGTFTPGVGGSVSIDVPVSDVGNPQPGDMLTGVRAFAGGNVGETVAGTGATRFTPADSAGTTFDTPTYDERVGETCPAVSVPESPAAPLLLAATCVWAVATSRRRWLRPSAAG